MMWIVTGQGGDGIARPCRAVEPPLEPLFEDSVERGRGLRSIQYACAWIDVGFNSVTADKGLAEGVDSGRRQLVELICSRRQGASLGVGQPIGQGQLQRLGPTARQECGHIT